MTVQLFGSKS